ncbi:MAG: hypothetical protein ACE15F_06450 [bacterium]
MMKTMVQTLVVISCVSGISNAQDTQVNLLAGGKVIASGYEGIPQYIYEGDFDDTPFLTRNGQLQDPAYVGVLSNRRMSLTSAVFYGGPVYEDGGWFDSAAKPVEFQIMANPGDPWTTAAVISTYPSLNGSDMAAAAAHTDGRFEVTFPAPVSCVGLRVAGKGAPGVTDGQSFVCINELRAFGTLGEAVNTYSPPRLRGALPIASTLRHPLERGVAPGDMLIDENVDTYVRCEELEAFGFKTFFGFFSANPLTLNSVSFIHGKLAVDGGWFNTEQGNPAVEIRRTLKGAWEPAGTIDMYPNTDGLTLRENLPADIETTEYKYTFTTPVQVYGVRIIGNGSFNVDETPFVQVGEMKIEGIGNPAFTGGVGTGFDKNGNPFKPTSQGFIFVEAEFGRPFNNGFTIMPHGDANNGYVVQGAFGPSFNQYTGQGIEYEIEVTQAGDYGVFAASDAPNTWGDSLFVSFDENPGINPDSIASGDITWRPPVDVSPVTFERDWITSDTLGQDFQEVYTLSAGRHILRFGLREPRYAMDWFVITPNLDEDITAFQPPAGDPPTGIQDFSIY